MKKQTILRIEIKNSCYCRGCYYSEDDWTLKGEGNTLQEAVDDLIKISSKEQILSCCPDAAYASEIDVVDFEGERFYSKNEKDVKISDDFCEKYKFPRIDIPNYIKDKRVTDQLIYSHILNVIPKLFNEHPRRITLKKANERLNKFKTYLYEKTKQEKERKEFERLRQKFQND